MAKITIQYEITTWRRGGMTTTVKERSFPSESALSRWADKMAGNITILRYENPRNSDPAETEASWS